MAIILSYTHAYMLIFFILSENNSISIKIINLTMLAYLIRRGPLLWAMILTKDNPDLPHWKLIL